MTNQRTLADYGLELIDPAPYLPLPGGCDRVGRGMIPDCLMSDVGLPALYLRSGSVGWLLGENWWMQGCLFAIPAGLCPEEQWETGPAEGPASNIERDIKDLRVSHARLMSALICLTSKASTAFTHTEWQQAMSDARIAIAKAKELR